ncbi:hypothetical protein Taro_017598, partial [Colocasia esculenta]|nr:hypothetical protein [Colocasia esculenta]
MLASLYRGVVGGSRRPACKRGGLCVPLLAACGGGLVALAVTVFHIVSEIGFLHALSCTYFCFRFVGVPTALAGDTWLFLPDLVVVRDVVFHELLCLDGFVPRCCFRIVFDSAGSAGVVFGLTRVVVEAFIYFRCFVVLC